MESFICFLQKLFHILHLEMDSRQKLLKFIRLNSAEARTEAHKFYENIGYVCDKTQKRFIKIFE